MTNDSRDYLKESWQICTEEEASRILTEAMPSHAVEKLKVSLLALQLRMLHAKFTAMIANEKLLVPTRNGKLKYTARTRPSRQLRTMQNAGRNLDKLLDQEKYPFVHDALRAAAMSYYYPHNIDYTFFDIRQFYSKLKKELKLLDELIEHLVAKKVEFEELDQGEFWLLDGEKEELEIRRNLYPYLQKSEDIQPTDFPYEGREHENPQHFLMWNIAILYDTMFDQKFNAVQRYDQPNFDPNSGETRYHGSGIRFACAIIKQLKLDDIVLRDSEASGNTEQDRLFNKVGDIWTNLPKSITERIAKFRSLSS